MDLTNLLFGVGGSAVVLELVSYGLVRLTRNRFQWMITAGRDRLPEINREEIEAKYINEKGGFDPELGWVRKSNTSGKDKIFCRLEKGRWGYRETIWRINERGLRANPGCEHLDDGVVSCYGDSFTFARQVNDGETWENNLSQRANINVLNWGVGNYGLDQALLRLEREFPKNPTKVVIMGTVADTISRVLSMWKHFYEYGNVWAFKPRFELDERDQLKLIRNIIDGPEKFLEIPSYIEELRNHDYFAASRFDKDLMKFPYLLSLLRNPSRNLKLIYGVLLKQTAEETFSQKARVAEPQDWNITKYIRRENLEWTARLYKDRNAVRLMHALVDRFSEQGKRLGFHPIFAFLPQKNELLHLRNGEEFYMPFLREISKRIDTIDVTTPLLNHQDLSSLYNENTVYGAHYSPKGNALVGEIMYNRLLSKGLIKGPK